jgi:alpha-beta hydrolase superfamily lysophospholipase
MTGQILRQTFTAHKDGVELALYRACPADSPPASGRPVLLLVHGSSISALPTYDLTVPGAGEYSVMNVFAGYGFDVWALDCENYGRSSRTTGNSDIQSGANDILAALDVVRAETGVAEYSLFGESSGALRVALFTKQHPGRVSNLILSAYTYTGEGSPTLSKRAQDIETFRKNSRRTRDRKMIESIFTRDMPGTSHPGVAAAIADVELGFGEEVPTGTYLDMVANLPIVDPKDLAVPVLMVTGEFDGISTVDDLLAFYRGLASSDKQFLILPATAHSVVWAKNRQIFWYAMRSFLQRPAWEPVAGKA